MNKKKITKVSSIFILIAVILMLESCCKKTAESMSLDIYYGEYVKGFVFVPADAANTNGIIRLMGEDHHSAPAIVYSYENTNQKEFERRDIVYAQIKLENDIYVAHNILKESEFDKSNPHMEEITSRSFRFMNLHGMFNHPQDPNHKFGHIKNIRSDISQPSPENPSYTYYLADQFIQNRTDPKIFDSAPVWIPQQYLSIDETNYFIEYEDFTIDHNGNSIPVIESLSLTEHHITDH